MFVTLESNSYTSREYASGIYYYDNGNPEMCDKVYVTDVANKDKTPVNDYSMLHTVK